MCFRLKVFSLSLSFSGKNLKIRVDTSRYRSRCRTKLFFHGINGARLCPPPFFSRILECLPSLDYVFSLFPGGNSLTGEREDWWTESLLNAISLSSCNCPTSVIFPPPVFRLFVFSSPLSFLERAFVVPFYTGFSYKSLCNDIFTG